MCRCGRGCENIASVEYNDNGDMLWFSDDTGDIPPMTHARLDQIVKVNRPRLERSVMNGESELAMREGWWMH